MGVGRGQYFVAGPRPETFIGQRQPRDPNGGPEADVLPSAAASYPAVYAPSEQSIQLTPNVVIEGFQNRVVTPPNAVSAVLQSQLPAAGWGNNFYPGLNISEPTAQNYYDEPTFNIDGNFPVDDGYVERSVDAFANAAVDPEDSTKGLLSPNWEQVPAEDNRPKFASRMNWSTAVLQRLADPDRPWNSVLNPYISVDWIPIDLTVFSGEVCSFDDTDRAGLGDRVKSPDGPDAWNVDDDNTIEDEAIPVDDLNTPVIENRSAFSV